MSSLNDSGKDLRFSSTPCDFFNTIFNWSRDNPLHFDKCFPDKKGFGERNLYFFGTMKLLSEEKNFDKQNSFFKNIYQYFGFKLSLMRISSNVFRHWNFDTFLTKVSLAYLRNFTLLNLERGADLGRSRIFTYFIDY